MRYLAEAVALVVLALNASDAWTQGCCPDPASICNSSGGRFCCNFTAADCGGGQHGGAPAGGASRQDSWQQTLDQENASAAADNARIAAEHQAYLKRKAAERAQSEQDAPPPAPAVSEDEKAETLRIMRGLDDKDKKKTAEDDGLQLRGFDRNVQPKHKGMDVKWRMRMCSDCLGVFHGESKPCEAISNHLKHSECINRALGVYNRCVGSVDCPGKIRPKITREKPGTMNRDGRSNPL